MLHRSLPLLLIVACAPEPAADDDTDAADTDPGVGDTDTDEADTAVVDSDLTDSDTDVVAPSCAPHELGPRTQLARQPHAGETVPYTWVTDLCLTPTSLDATIAADVVDEAGDRFCGGTLHLSSSTPDGTCADCEFAYADVVVSAVAMSDADLCAYIGFDDIWRDGVASTYARFGVDLDTMSVRLGSGEEWTGDDPSGELTSSVEVVDGVTHVTLSWARVYHY